MNITKLLTAFFLIGISLTTYAQSRKELKAARQHIVDQSEFIFEGSIIQAATWYHEETDDMYHSFIIEIGKIIKGDDRLQYGTVQYTVKANSNWKFRQRTEALWVDRRKPGGAGVTSGIFFGKISEDDFLPEVISENNFNLIELSQINYSLFTEKFHYFWRDKSFKTKDDIYNYFEKEHKLEVPDDHPEYIRKKRYNFLEWEELPEWYKKRNSSFKNTQQDADRLYVQQWLENRLSNQGSQLKASTTTTANLTLSVANSVVSVDDFEGGTGVYFEFDIMAESDNPSVFFDNAFFYINLDNGFNILSGEDDKISVSYSDYFPQADYHVAAFSTSDKNRLLISALTRVDAQGNYGDRVHIIGKQKLMRVKIAIDHHAKNTTSLDLENHSLFLSGYSTTKNQPGSIDYNSVTQIDGNNLAFTAKPEVESFEYAAPLIAGAGQILTIKGKNFGNGRGQGGIKMINSNYPDTIGFGLEEYDFQVVQVGEDLPNQRPGEYWTDTEIRIIVPSSQFNLSNCAGSGDFALTNGWGRDNKNFWGNYTQITIDGAYANFAEEFDNKKYRVYLADQYGNGRGGLKFKLDSTIFTEEQITVIQQAFNDWESSNSQFDIALALDLNPDSDAISQLLVDNNMGAYTMKTDNGIVLTQSTYNGDDPDMGTTEKRAYVADSDIRINLSHNWSYKLPGEALPTDKRDFYATVLHELGHVLALYHVNNPEKLMHYSFSEGWISANNRINLNNNADENAVLLALNTIGLSKDITWLNGANTLSGKPSAPSGLVTQQHPDYSVKLNWTLLDVADSYILQLSTQPYSGYSQIASLSGSISEYIDNTSKTVGTVYYYRIKSRNGAGDSDWSEPASIILEATAPPSAPTWSGSPIMDEHGVYFQWYSSPGATSYEIQRAEVPSTDYATIYTNSNVDLDYTDITYEHGKSYNYRILAVNDLGSAASSVQTYTIPHQPIQPPNNITVEPYSSSRIDLTWDAVPAATSYDIYSCVGTLIVNTIATGYSHTGLISDSYYTYKIVTKNSEEESDFSACVSDYTLPVGAKHIDPILVGTLNVDNRYTDTKNNSVSNNFGDYYGEMPNYTGNQTSDDIFYKFTLSESSNVTISTAGSAVYSTVLHLHDNSYSHLYTSFVGPADPCERNYLAETTIYLSAGTYYVISEGEDNTSGSIKTTISVSSFKSALAKETISDIEHESSDFTINEIVTVYPNPTENVVNLKFNEVQKSVTISIISANGMKVHESSCHACQLETLDVSHLNSGTYLVTINMGAKIVTKKIQVQ